jgi:hypothetical protein
MANLFNVIISDVPNYNEAYIREHIVWVLQIMGFLFFLDLLLLGLRSCVAKKKQLYSNARFTKVGQVYQEVETQDSSASSQDGQSDLYYLPVEPVRLNVANGILNILLMMTESLLAFGVILILDILIAFDCFLYETLVFVGGLKFILMMCVYISVAYRSAGRFGYDAKEVFRFVQKWFCVIMPLAFLYIFGFMALTIGTCACTHSNTLPGYIEDDQGMNLSTAFTRSYTDADICSAEEFPCMVYATFPENAATEVFLNMHINQASCKNKSCRPSVLIKEGVHNSMINEDDWRAVWVTATPYQTPPSEYMKRNIYTAHIKDLKPSTVYTIITDSTFYSDRNKKFFTYKTVNTRDMTIVAGGDIGNNEIASAMIENVVSKANADIIMVGGDTAYDQNSAN